MDRGIREAEVIDIEWLALIMEAREIGLTVEDVRSFLDKNTLPEKLAEYQPKKTSYK
ncbi:anti-repressor SinI family protein [Neobacillus sp. Marseille-QA0830]